MDLLNLQKGEVLDLNKASHTPLTIVAAGAGWDMATEGATVDIDLSAFALRKGKLSGDNICYFNNKCLFGGAIESMGDNLTGEGDGDDETINVALSKLPADVDEVVFVLNIYDSVNKGQSFAQVENAHVHVYNQETKQELGWVKVSGTTDTYDSLIFAKMVRTFDGWSFEAVKEFKNADLNGLAALYM